MNRVCSTDVPYLLGQREVVDELLYRGPRCTLVHDNLSRTLGLAIGGRNIHIKVGRRNV